MAMNCFNHPDSVGVAICKWCERCLCRACVRETAKGIVCSAECEANLVRFWSLQEEVAEETAKLYRSRKPARRSALATYAVSFVAALFIVSFFAWIIFIGIEIGRQTK
jgi:hypothetical protein